MCWTASPPAFRPRRTSSISVNRNVRHFRQPVFLHSECSHTMISVKDYEEFLMPIDAEWSRRHTPWGIHHCGKDPHRFAASYAKLPRLDFLDLGWGGNVALLRRHLPHTFFNIRLDPVSLVRQTPAEIRETIIKLVRQSDNPWLTGVCSVNWIRPSAMSKSMPSSTRWKNYGKSMKRGEHTRPVCKFGWPARIFAAH